MENKALDHRYDTQDESQKLYLRSVNDDFANQLTLDLAIKKIEGFYFNQKTFNVLNANDFSLDICEKLLSIYKTSDWRILNPIRARKAELINAQLVEIKEHDLLKAKNEKICPSEITSGMHIYYSGYVGKVVEVKRYETKESDEPYCYKVFMEYVCGELKMHRYFTEAINNGVDNGYLSVQQGNRRASFIRIKAE